MVVLVAALAALCSAAAAQSCGAILTQRKGLLQTPKFPAPLQVPIKCQWLIDSSGLQEEDVQIVVYFTQLYVTSGLTFTEYAFYDPEDPNLQKNPRLLLSITEQNSVTTRWLFTNFRFLVIELSLDQLEGNHLRVLDHLLDVFGFNITYEMVTGAVRNDSCSVIDCSFAGNCYIDACYNEFWCSCFPGFSGPSCNLGPICKPDLDPCLNGGVCRHAGKYPTCTCLEGYTGSRCETTLTDPRCEDNYCSVRCRLPNEEEPPCDCSGSDAIEGDRWRYILTLELDNITSLTIQHPGNTLNNYLEKQFQKFLRSFSLSPLEDVKILNMSDSGQVSFHFFGDLLDHAKVRLGQQKLSQRGRIGEIFLSKSPVQVHHEQGLRLEDIQVNNWEVFENEQVILSCIALGSEQMEFSWYKDGHPIDPLKGLGSFWMHILPKNSREEYTAILGIDAAKVVDGGRYTCQVTDWGIQACKSFYLQVEPPPDILVSPMAVSVKKGDKVDLTCVSINQKTSYSWTRDKNLFPLNTSSEVWEDLKPWGSILRIKNIQKSVTYTCHAQTQAAIREKSIHIDLLAPDYCKETRTFEIVWKSTSPGSLAMTECPPRYIGYSSRYCASITPGEARWEEPDYSKCISEFLDHIITDFQVISRGTVKTNLWMLLSELYSWIGSRTPLYRGEGESVLDFLSDVTTFVNLTFTSEEVLNVTKVFYANVDSLLSQHYSIIHIEKLEILKTLVDKWSLMWAQHANLTMAYFLYNEMVIDIRKLSNQGLNQYYIPMPNSYPRWYTANIAIKIMSQGNQMKRFTVVNYKNITKFLPKLSSQIPRDGKELLYEIQSNVISISFHGDMEIHLDMTLPLKSQRRNNWNISCARADAIDLEWDITSCIQVPTVNNSSRCICNRPGLYTVLFTRISSDKLEEAETELSSPMVALGCGCCLFQSCLTLLLLSCRRAFLHLLKVQFCLAVCSVMAIFVYVTRVVPSKNTYPLISILLELLFFSALSAHLGKLLIIYSEVVFLQNSKSTKRTVLGLTTGVTLLPCLISGTVESFFAKKFRSCWWLAIGSASFYTAACSVICLIVLFVILSVALLRRLHYLKAVKNPKSSCTIDRRLGLMKRTSVLFTMTIFVSISSVFFVNTPNLISIYIFGFLSAFLGFLIFVCYILHSESPLNVQLIKHFKITAKDQDDSNYNLFNFFKKQESEVESKDAPFASRESGTEMKEITSNFLNKTKLGTFQNQSTFVKKEQNVDLEVYPNSPKKLCKTASESAASSFDIISLADGKKKPVAKATVGQAMDLEEMGLLKDNPAGTVVPCEVMSSISHDLDFLLNRTYPHISNVESSHDGSF